MRLDVAKRGGTCLGCGSPAGTRQGSYCDDCRQQRLEARVQKTGSVTLGELRERYSTSQYHAKVRGHARLAFARSGRAFACQACGYDLHVDICHIRDVGDFPPDATLNEVNALPNLLALDKRCHWEFDHGYLLLETDQASGVVLSSRAA